jgi:hypothetical protein
MKKLTRLPALLLALNWLLFAVAFVLTCKAQGNVLWWLRIDWSAWLSAYGAMAAMTDIPAGSVWVMWLLSSVALTLLVMLLPRSAAAAAAAMPTESAQAARRQLDPKLGVMEQRPELKEKILKLHQSLERI